MKIVNTVTEVKKELSKARNLNNTIGFVPTMGALHNGHLQLVKRSAEEADFTVVSIYVNPTQFNNKDDLETYPRNLVEDVNRLSATGCNLLFCPSNSAMYPDGYSLTKIQLDGLENVLEGVSRPGHFDGVVTVVSRFFNIIKPNFAYFGEKDYQQLLVVKKVAKSISNSINIVPCSIERETSGLAMSSRNQRLNEKQKDEALLLYSLLTKAKLRISSYRIDEIEEWIVDQFNSHTTIELEYFKIVDQDNLRSPKNQKKDNLRAFVAAIIGGVRLIDNMKL